MLGDINQAVASPVDVCVRVSTVGKPLLVLVIFQTKENQIFKLLLVSREFR